MMFDDIYICVKVKTFSQPMSKSHLVQEIGLLTRCRDQCAINVKADQCGHGSLESLQATCLDAQVAPTFRHPSFAKSAPNSCKAASRTCDLLARESLHFREAFKEVLTLEKNGRDRKIVSEDLS